jgi:hypothetical protein
MTRKMSSILETRFRLLEDEKFIREMETEMDYFKEQMFLMSEAIKEKQFSTDRLRSRLERLAEIGRTSTNV